MCFLYVLSRVCHTVAYRLYLSICMSMPSYYSDIFCRIKVIITIIITTKNKKNKSVSNNNRDSKFNIIIIEILYTVSQKRGATKFMAVTLPNLSRFSILLPLEREQNFQ